MPSMFRESDGAGDSGAMSQAIYRDPETGEPKIDNGARPRVGVKMRVGSITARSYSSQDWWLTNYITEIIEDYGDFVRFKTGSNSIYTWRV